MSKLEFKLVDDASAWNSFVQSFERYTFVQSWEYTFVYETLCDEVLRYGVFLDGKLCGLLPICIVKARRGKYLRMRHSPILSEIMYDEEYFKQILNFLSVLARTKKMDCLRIQPVIKDDTIYKKFGFREAPTHNLDAEHTLQLLLKGEDNNEVKAEQNLLANMRKQTRYYIRRSSKEGVSVVEDNDDFESFYKILKHTANRQHYTSWSREYFERLLNLNKDNIHLYFAEFEGKRVATGFFIDFGKYRFYSEGGMFEEFSSKYPSYAIQWRSITDALKLGKEIYDFWGGVAPKNSQGEIKKNYPWAGIDLFKRGFGGEEVTMVHPLDLPLSYKYWITWIYETIERKKRGY